MIRRHDANPLIEPNSVKPSAEGYRVEGVFNAGAAEFNGEIILLLRVAENYISRPGYLAVPYYTFTEGQAELKILELKTDDPEVQLKDTRGVVYKGRDYVSTLSHLRIARSFDGINFKVEDKPFIYPGSMTESFGIEDPRIVKIEDMYYITYTAISGDGWATALAVTRDFVTFESRGIIFPPPNKDVCIFSEKVNGKYCALHRPHNLHFGRPAIWYSDSPDLIYWGNHRCLIRPRDNEWEDEKIGGGAAPLKTDKGWLEIYHGKGKNQVYSLWLLLLDLDDPSVVLKRGKEPILFPQEPYEKEGFVPNVVFSNGVISRNDGTVNIYYGAGDETVCLAEASIDELLSMF